MHLFIYLFSDMFDSFSDVITWEEDLTQVNIVMWLVHCGTFFTEL